MTLLSLIVIILNSSSDEDFCFLLLYLCFELFDIFSSLSLSLDYFGCVMNFESSEESSEEYFHFIG